jgi:hypothetical protein
MTTSGTDIVVDIVDSIKEAAMKTLNILLIAFAILIFSGCYTQLLIEDDPPTSANAQPMPPAMEPVIIYVVQPEPAYIPDPLQMYLPPAYLNPVTSTPVPAPVQRTSGVQRSGAETPQTPPQKTTRDSGATRGGGR